MKSILLATSTFFLALIILSCTKAKAPSLVIPALPVAINTTPLPNTVSKTDTLNVMAYNILLFGDGCQGSTAVLDTYLKTIVAYAQPDVLSCEKINSFDPTANSSLNLAIDISTNALNAAFPGRYGYATPTNISASSTMSLLFFNKQKLTFIKTETLVASITDFNLYKLLYNDINLAITHDSTFLYVLVNHTKSGSTSDTRDQQVSAEMTAIRAKFKSLPNLVIMGDFNTRNSSEAGYQAIVNATDSTTKMSDTPFFPDARLTYPADWDNQPQNFKPYLTTSTRYSTSIPNSCGTGGGARSWYDHIFISPWLVKGSKFMRYIPNSYRTIGNDGNRLGVDENSSLPVANTSAPDAVIQAIFQLSNKYPVEIKLLVRANRTGSTLANPAERN